MVEIAVEEEGIIGRQTSLYMCLLEARKVVKLIPSMQVIQNSTTKFVHPFKRL
jgi:hypothetical protein